MTPDVWWHRWPWGAAVQQRSWRSSPGCGALCRAGLNRGGGAALQSNRVCALCHQCSWHSCGSRSCSWSISDLPAESCCVNPEQLWLLLLQSKAGEGREPGLPQGTVTTACNSLQLLAVQIPTAAGTHLCNFSPWKAESLSGQKWQTRSDSVGYVGEKPRFLLSLQHLTVPLGLGLQTRPALAGNASCVLPLQPQSAAGSNGIQVMLALLGL